MSLKGLYTGSKGKYQCKVCTISPHRASRQQDIEAHIKSAHLLTTVTWFCRNDPDDPELPGDAQVEAHASDELSPEVEFLRSLTREKLNYWHMSSIECGSHEDAVKKIKSTYGLPKQHYIQCYFPCVVDGAISIAVEEYNNIFSYPTRSQTQNAIRHVINNAMELELNCKVGNLENKSMVNVDYLPKFTSMPVEFRSYNDFRASIDIQSLQICECVDVIVGDGINDENYKMFRARLLGAKTIVDLHSMLYSPYLTSERMQPIHFCSGRLLTHYTTIDRADFNAIIGKFQNEWANIAASSVQNRMSWQDSLKNSKYQDLIDMLNTRVFWDGRPKPYDNSPACNHEYIYNSNRHINDNQLKIYTLEDMHRMMKEMFCTYPSESWEYMHVHGLNAYFGSEEFAYGFLNLASKLTDTSDNNFYFPPLLEALNMCCIMFAKFHTLHLRRWTDPVKAPFHKELEVVANEIESCIKGLQSSHKDKHNCLLIRLEAYQLKDVDILVFRSVRIILFALEFMRGLIGGEESTGWCISTAIENVTYFLSDFSKLAQFEMQLSRGRINAITSSMHWPPLHVVRKIAGLSFIFTEGGRSSFYEKSLLEFRKLVAMLQEDPPR